MKKTVKVKLDLSTWRWLRAFARANSNTQLNQRTVTPGELLGKAAFCMADHAGRRNSWQSNCASMLLEAFGYQASIPFARKARLQKLEGGQS